MVPKGSACEGKRVQGRGCGPPLTSRRFGWAPGLPEPSCDPGRTRSHHCRRGGEALCLWPGRSSRRRGPRGGRDPAAALREERARGALSGSIQVHVVELVFLSSHLHRRGTDVPSKTLHPGHPYPLVPICIPLSKHRRVTLSQKLFPHRRLSHCHIMSWRGGRGRIGRPLQDHCSVWIGAKKEAR